MIARVLNLILQKHSNFREEYAKRIKNVQRLGAELCLQIPLLELVGFLHVSRLGTVKLCMRFA